MTKEIVAASIEYLESRRVAVLRRMERAKQQQEQAAKALKQIDEKIQSLKE